MSGNEKILDKIRKLMKLAENNINLNEASAAFSQAQSLLTRHRLTMAEVENTRDIIPEDERIVESGRPLYSGERVIHWKSYLSDKIAKYNGCKMYVRTIYVCKACESRFVPGNHICLKCQKYVGHKKQCNYLVVGRPGDIEIVEYMFVSISRQIEMLCKRAMEEGKGSGKTYANNFKYGCSETVITRLREVYENVRKEYEGSAAMVLVDRKDEEVLMWVNENLGKLKQLKSASRNDKSALEQGREAGHQVSLNKGIGGSGNKNGGMLS